MFLLLDLHLKHSNGYGLFLQIGWQSITSFSPCLLLNFCSRLLRSYYAPHLMKCIHVKWQIEYFTFVVCNGI